MDVVAHSVVVVVHFVVVVAGKVLYVVAASPGSGAFELATECEVSCPVQ